VSSSATIIKSPRPRYTLAKSSEPPRSITTTSTRPRPSQVISNKPKISTTTNNSKTRIPTVIQQSRRVSDLDALMAEQRDNKSTIISPSPIINSLFSPDTVKLVRPVRGQELKIFSNHLTSEISFQTSESLSTLTPPSLESIVDSKSIEKNNDYSCSSFIVTRDFSEDSLNEHYHIQKLLKQSKSYSNS
jgi:hypothetical protein